MYEQMVEEFVAAGGRRAFGITGSGPSLRLIDSLEGAGVEFITTGHESTAALMSGVSARLSGSPALALTIKGPGFMNMLPGLLCNAYEGYASISISESYPQGHADARCHKWLDHERAGGEFLKRHLFYASGQGLLKHCWQAAGQEYPGPVHMDLGAGENPTESTMETKITPEFERVRQTIAESSRPMLVIGSLGLRADWSGELQGLPIPVLTTPSGKGAIDEHSPMAAGVFTGAGKTDTPEKQLLPEADLLITLGARAGELLNPAFGIDTLNLDTIPPSAGRVFPARPLAGQTHVLDEGQIRDLFDLLQEKAWGRDMIADSHARLDAIAEGFGWSPVAAMRRVQAMMPGAIQVLDTGNYTVMGEHFLKAKNNHEVLGTPNGRYMGAALGYALGASFAMPETPVILWIGDGGIRSLMGELALAAEHNRRLLVLVMKDGNFGSIRGSALSNGLTQKPVELSKRSLVRIGEALGLNTGIIENEAGLAEVLEAWRRDPGPALYECPLNPDNYIELTACLR